MASRMFGNHTSSWMKACQLTLVKDNKYMNNLTQTCLMIYTYIYIYVCLCMCPDPLVPRLKSWLFKPVLRDGALVRCPVKMNFWPVFGTCRPRWSRGNMVGLGGLRVTCSPRDPRFAGSNLAEVNELFQDVKILSTSLAGGTLSWVVPSQRFQAC